MREKVTNITLIDILKSRVETFPDKLVYTFLSDKEEYLITNAELLQKVRGVASCLLPKISSGSRAILLLQPSLDYIIAFLGCLMAGITAIPAYPPSNTRHTQRLYSVIADASASVMITTTPVSNQYCFENLQLFLIDHPEMVDIDEEKFPIITQDTLAFLQYTSGSTGNPKGVMISHGNILANANVISKLLNRSVRKVCSWLPPFHDMGLIGGILYPLTVDADVILMAPTRFLRKPFLWLKAISDHQVDTSPAPNFAYELCINTITEEEKAQLDLSHWRIALNGAEPVNAKTLEKFAQAFASCGFKAESCYPTYGMAETTLMVSGKKPTGKTVVLHVDKEALKRNEIKKVEDTYPSKISLVSCGKVDSDHKVNIIVPGTNQVLGFYEIGEITIAGPIVAQGYWNKPELSEQQFRLRLQNNEEFFLKTGDLGFKDENGELFITGRLKDLIIIRGQNIYPQDLEASVAESHRQLIPSGTAAFALESEEDYELVIVQEVHRHAKNFDEIFSAILKCCSEEFSILPSKIVFIQQSTLPKTSSGKVQRNLCKQALLNNELKIIAQWQRGFEQGPSDSGQSSQQIDELQRWMKQWLSSELKIDEQQIIPTINFAHYGIDSLKAVRFCVALEEKLKTKINPSLLWTYSTIEQLAGYLMGGLPENETVQLHNAHFEPIAIIGMSCRFPGQVDNPETFWQLLENGRDGITEIPSERWNIADYYDPKPATPGKMISRKGGFIDNIDKFDATLFNISSSEANEMDPQHRLLLELTWEALECSGIPPLSLDNTSSGVFVGISSNDYSHLKLNFYAQDVNGFYGLGNAHSAAAGRIAYFFGTRGQAFAVDTACSSSLVAVSNACRDLQTNSCDLAIAGGVNLILEPSLSISFSQAGMLSPDGKCQVFDANANGYVRSEGGGVVILKRLSDAKRDRNKILAVIKSAVVNSDGHSNGITAPSPVAQKELITKAIHLANLPIDAIGYVEAHGTGTRLGDPIEFNALKDIFATGSRETPLCIGSVKTNIGHLEAAAGMAGLIKTILILQHKKIPANLHFNQVNPLIDLDQIPARVPVNLESWETTATYPIRYAGVSSFGFTGTNAHLVLEEAPQSIEQPTTTPERPVHILTLSAHSQDALKAQRSNLLALLEHEKMLNLPSLCHSLNTERSHLDFRLAVYAQTVDELKINLQNASIQSMPPCGLKKIAFLFTGMGSQYSEMGKQLYRTQPVFKAEVDYCCRIVNEYFPECMQEVMFNPQKGTFLQESEYSQPALFILEYALARLWLHWGIKPTAVIGHSLGEYVAATIAGMMRIEDGLKLIVWRARLMQMQKPGAMLALVVDGNKAQELLKIVHNEIPDAILAIAAINSKTQTVFSGDMTAISRLESFCQTLKIKTTKLDVAHAFHSELMQPMIREFTQIANTITYSKPTMLVISNVTGKALESIDGHYWAEHVLAKVNFSVGINELIKENYTIFFEMGPQPVLLSFAMAHHPTPDEALWLTSLKKGQKDWDILSGTLVSIYRMGIDIDWFSFDNPYQIKPCPQVLPTYPFQRQRYWLPLDKSDNKRPEKDYLEQVLNKSVYQIGWEKLSSPMAIVNNKSELWLIFANEENTDTLEKMCSDLDNVIVVKPGEIYSENKNSVTLNPIDVSHFQQLLNNISLPFSVIYFWGFQKNKVSSLSNKEFNNFLQRACSGMLNLGQALATAKNINKIWVATSAALSPFKAEYMPLSMTLVGMCKTLVLEYPKLDCQLVDFESGATGEEVANHLLQLIGRNYEELVIAVSQNNYYAQRLDDYTLKLSRNKVINAEASYLITGGFGGIGFTLCQWLIQQGARFIVLLGRRELNGIQEQLDTLVTAGVTISYFQADVSNFKQLKNTLLSVQQKMPAIEGIFHTAGVLADSLWLSLNWTHFEDVFQAKIQGSWNLHCLSIELKLNLRHFILFSSISSLLGSSGQANYAAANAFLDGLAHYRHQLDLPALAINFGPWERLGMTRRQNQSWLEVGIQNIPVQEGMATLEAMMSSSATELCLLPHTVSENKLRAFPRSHRKLLSRIVQTEKIQKVNDEPWQNLKDLSKEEQLLYINDVLFTAIQKILHLPENKPITGDNTLLSLGMDSLLAVDLLHKLKAKLPPEVNLTAQVLLYENHSIYTLIEVIQQQLSSVKQTRSDSNVLMPPNSQFMQLSLQQVRIWRHIQQQPDNPAYVVSYSLELNGIIDADILEQSIQAVINRHDMLRCSFHSYLGNIFQYCHEKVAFNLDRLDFSKLSDEEHDLYIEKQLRQVGHQQFDLAQAPLFKSTLIQCARERALLTVNISHLLTDGASSLIVLQDILHFYHLYLTHSYTSLPAAVPYQCFINWQLLNLVNGNYQHYANFWREKLKNFNPPQLPVDKERQMSMTPQVGSKEIIPVTIRQLKALQHMVKQNQTTIATVLLAIYGLLLTNMANTTHAFVTVLVSGRDLEDYKTTVGNIANEVPSILHCKPEYSFIEFIHKIQDDFAKSLPYQYFQPEQMVELDLPVPDTSFDFQVLQPEQFDVGFSMKPVCLKQPNIPLWGEKPRKLSLKWTYDGSLSGYIKYRSDLYNTETIVDFVQQFLKVLAEIIKNPTITCKELIALSKEIRVWKG
ncbi:type I polyketide synthase [Legionella hackeliae]|uniref:Beta-ketoacyl synthase n=1 Tax=Legionella hackeliae TaxID=449 RepID=A0A0A8UV81_LEGHA